MSVFVLTTSKARKLRTAVAKLRNLSASRGAQCALPCFENSVEAEADVTLDAQQRRIQHLAIYYRNIYITLSLSLALALSLSLSPSLSLDR